MKTLTAFVFILASFAFCRADWTPVDTCDYLAVLKVGYTDSAFEGGFLYQLPAAPARDGLPLQMIFTPSWDFASVYFTLTTTSAVVLRAGVIWMGTGAIEVPDTFYAPGWFAKATTRVVMPNVVTHFYHEPLDSTYKDDFAWKAVDSLSLVNSLLARKSFVGFYLYPPTVGAFDPTTAKVIVFIYACRKPGSGIKNMVRAVRQESEARHVVGKRNGIAIEKGKKAFDVRGRRGGEELKAKNCGK